MGQYKTVQWDMLYMMEPVQRNMCLMHIQLVPLKSTHRNILPDKVCIQLLLLDCSILMYKPLQLLDHCTGNQLDIAYKNWNQPSWCNLLNMLYRRSLLASCNTRQRSWLEIYSLLHQNISDPLDTVNMKRRLQHCNTHLDIANMC